VRHLCGTYADLWSYMNSGVRNLLICHMYVTVPTKHTPRGAEGSHQNNDKSLSLHQLCTLLLVGIPYVYRYSLFVQDAIRMGCTRSLKALMSFASPRLINHQDDSGYTALFHSVGLAKDVYMRILLAARADVNLSTGTKYQRVQ
jgi:hypothetical protein